MMYFSTLLLSMFITIGLIPILNWAAYSLKAVDLPNERKVHTVPVPRIGGLAMAAGVILPFLLSGRLDGPAFGLLLGSLVIVIFGVADDIFDLSYKIKFAGQIGAALCLVFGGFANISSMGDAFSSQWLLMPWLAIPVAVFVVVAATNAVNLADGLDGLAGGMLLQVFLCLSILAYISGDMVTVMLAVAVMGAIFGFLRYNTHPASIFMGDTGSQFIGFLAIALSIRLTQMNEVLSPFLPLLLLGFPLLDTFMVIVQRLQNRMPLFRADNNHLHHRLIDMGLYHREAVFLMYCVQACFVSSAYLFRFHSDGMILFVLGLLIAFLVLPLYLASNTGFTLPRDTLFDTYLKKRLRLFFKEKTIVLMVMQKSVEYGLCLMFLVAALLPATVPVWIGVPAMVLAVALCVACAADSGMEMLIRIMAYGLIPCLLFEVLQNRVDWLTPVVLQVMALFFGIVVFLTILVLKFTRRRKGFSPTPTDFLVVLVAVIVPNLPLPAIETMHLGVWVSCLVAFFFIVEVVLGELRGQVRRFGVLFLAPLCVLGIRCLAM